MEDTKETRLCNLNCTNVYKNPQRLWICPRWGSSTERRCGHKVPALSQRSSQNKRNSMISLQILSLIMVFFCFFTSLLYIYYELQFCDFMKFLNAQTCLSLCLNFLNFFFGSFSLVDFYFVLFQCVCFCFVLFYYNSLDTYLLSQQRQ